MIKQVVKLLIALIFLFVLCFRTSKGRKTSLPIYNDDDNDLSDLGLSKNNGVPNNDDVFQENQNVS